ncbi:transcriptional repressor [Auraticoccus sp. F435]|uniref:Transcriptional repressor n=1 Tax=Auraticoccus cholistanensis TaxID=2656650 RepID=A0A6A9UTB1_9ACTN|nr:Fur family transcriptional regulator [Auraticoccus cholistanensis]MVA74427.1 transcriptional repressor [Auraticoccus cholistanensis]
MTVSRFRQQAAPGSDATVALLRARGLRVTTSRVAVLEVLREAAPTHEHLSAGAVEERVRARLGNVSTQGVYDCLEALTGAELVRRLEPAGHPALYESRVDNHHHLVCRSCGLVTDVDCVVGAAPCLHTTDTGGFVVDEAEVTFWGRCASCA